MKTTQFGINMGQCSGQAYFKFHPYKQSSHTTISSLCFFNLTPCTVTITSVIMCCTEVCGHLIMSFIIKSIHKDLVIRILGGMQMFCRHNCNYNICNYVLYRGLRPPGNVLHHNKVSSCRSTHSYFLGGTQMFCGHNWFIVLIRWWTEFFSVATYHSYSFNTS